MALHLPPEQLRVEVTRPSRVRARKIEPYRLVGYCGFGFRHFHLLGKNPSRRLDRTPAYQTLPLGRRLGTPPLCHRPGKAWVKDSMSSGISILDIENLDFWGACT